MVKIEKVKIVVNKKEFDLTLEEVKELMQILKDNFEPRSVITVMPGQVIPYVYPYPYYQRWETIPGYNGELRITCLTSDSSQM